MSTVLVAEQSGTQRPARHAARTAEADAYEVFARRREHAMNELATLTSALNADDLASARESAARTSAAFDQLSRSVIAIVVGYGRDEPLRAEVANASFRALSQRAVRQLGRVPSTRSVPVVHRCVARFAITADGEVAAIDHLEM